MIRVTRHNEIPFEITAELITFLESLGEDLTFVNVDGEVLVRKQKQASRVNQEKRSHSARATAPGPMVADTGVENAD
jgi:hypothetical protein